MQVLIDGKHKAIMGKGRPLADCPKSYKKVGVVYHSIGDLFNPNENLYNPRTMTIYSVRDNSLRYEIYRDGSFFPFYGRLTYLKEEDLQCNKTYQDLNQSMRKVHSEQVGSMPLSRLRELFQRLKIKVGFLLRQAKSGQRKLTAFKSI